MGFEPRLNERDEGMGRRVRKMMERYVSFVRDSKECGERDERELEEMS